MEFHNGISTKKTLKSDLNKCSARSETILKGDHPLTIQAKFGLIWFSGFRGEDFFLWKSSETRVRCAV